MEKLKNEKIEEVELQPSWSKLKSFHGKAIVGTKENGDKYLKSFGFLICEIIKGEVKIHNEVDKWDSKSTIRHINNFLYENNFETGNTKELTELYITKTKKVEKQEEKKETEKPVDTVENTKEEKHIKKSKIKKDNNSKTENQKSLVKVGA